MKRQINLVNQKQPKDKNAKIWRYLDFTKFVSLLLTDSLFLSRADKFDDPFEGIAFGLSFDTENDGKPMAAYNQENIRKMHKTLQRFTAISCWHLSDYESAAMWKLYLKSDEGIAIQSTYSKLFEAIQTNEELWLGEVEYIDYMHDRMKGISTIHPYFHKRRSFEHEKELRLIHQTLPVDWKQSSNGPWIYGEFAYEMKAFFQGGIAIPIDVKQLIEKIYISPTAQSWFKEMVENVIAKYGHVFEIEQSSLYDRTVI